MTIEKEDDTLAEEAKWAELISHGDQRALVTFYETHVDQVYSYFYAEVRGNNPLAEILTVETFRRIVYAFMSDDCMWHGKYINYWLHTIAQEVLKEDICTPFIEKLQLVLERGEQREEDEGMLDFLVRQEEQQKVWRLVEGLEPKERQCLFLYHRRNLPYADIAHLLGYSEDTCRHIHGQALAHLHYRVRMRGSWDEVGEGQL